MPSSPISGWYKRGFAIPWHNCVSVHEATPAAHMSGVIEASQYTLERRHGRYIPTSLSSSFSNDQAQIKPPFFWRLCSVHALRDVFQSNYIAIQSFSPAPQCRAQATPSPRRSDAQLSQALGTLYAEN
ncbi:hypothetical protein PMIN06_000013 [Paraphaeosphaeria minitans]